MNMKTMMWTTNERAKYAKKYACHCRQGQAGTGHGFEDPLKRVACPTMDDYKIQWLNETDEVWIFSDQMVGSPLPNTPNCVTPK